MSEETKDGIDPETGMYVLRKVLVSAESYATLRAERDAALAERDRYKALMGAAKCSRERCDEKLGNGYYIIKNDNTHAGRAYCISCGRQIIEIDKRHADIYEANPMKYEIVPTAALTPPSAGKDATQ